jgi:hypothetical protein
MVGGVAGCGYGLATGARSGIFVVDLDTADANERFNDLGNCPPTFTVASARGWHLYFTVPDFAVRTSAGELAPGIDIRGDGGFVVTPGSPHRSGLFYEVTDDVPPAPAPAWLLKWKGLRKSKPRAAGPGAVDFEKAIRNTVPRGWRIERAKAWLATRPAAIEGEGGEKLTWNTLLCAVKQCALTDAEMVEEAFAEWNARCAPPWEGAQWGRNIEQAIKSTRVPWNTALDLTYAAEISFARCA